MFRGKYMNFSYITKDKRQMACNEPKTPPKKLEKTNHDKPKR